MTQTQHREYRGAALEKAAATTLETSGERWTEMRAAVFRALSAMDGPASAYDIADAVSKARGKRVAPNSIYRILDLFVATNVVKRVETQNAYVANAHPECLHDCIFLICDDCGAITHLDDDALAAEMRARAAGTGFKPNHPVMEVRGTCADCAA
ncbi:Fur family transcriptional regulator [Pacificimonas flava]|uniref:Ferric uptake regulation protein n=1 Tax=Pacificimonas flava TaxID=1234595 RepID=M2U7X1_9SPHN|nr:Fur family transcriptional regulator [Pacificimonas flava]EMD84103.1 Zinc uptake regulation protein ZUR [Pacificimonas flava]MBB5280019.1 Fur family zinc uptake transcriptional regulator [Pacificimonas flava]